MGAKSKIEWTDATWNPVKGCSRVSEGCRNCYAERIAARFSGVRQEWTVADRIEAAKGEGYFPPHEPGPFTGFAVMTPSGPRWTGRVELDESKLELPLHWRKPRRIFVNSMSDLYHEKLPIEDQELVFRMMLAAPQHEYIILTKRAALMEERLPQIMHRICGPHYRMPEFIIFCVSAEDQATADERIPHLLRTPAARRGVSLEPLLGPVKLDADWLYSRCRACGRHGYRGQVRGWCYFSDCQAITEDQPLLDGVIVGGESGPGARPVHPDWVRAIRDQCQEAGVPFFFEQWGEWGLINDVLRSGECTIGSRVRGEMFRCGKKRAGTMIDGREWREWPK